MTLRDQYGEVEVGISDRFRLGEALLAVVCPNPDQTICCRVYEGEMSVDAGKVGPQSLIDFHPAEVCGLVREHRLMTFDIAPPAETPARIDKKTPRAPASKKSARKHEPTSPTLFD